MKYLDFLRVYDMLYKSCTRLTGKKGESMNLHESGEMYLETILILTQQGKPVHSIDVAKYMNFSKPSVSRAIGILRDAGYVAVDDQGHLLLTPSGLEIAEKIYERHNVLTEFLVNLGVEEGIAADDACKIEHDISDVSFDVIKKFVSGMKK